MTAFECHRCGAKLEHAESLDHAGATLEVAVTGTASALLVADQDLEPEVIHGVTADGNPCSLFRPLEDWPCEQLSSLGGSRKSGG